VVDLSSSSDEKGLIADVSRDEEFARRIFGELNCGVLGPPGDGKIIILNDFDEEEEEACEEKTIGTKDASTYATVNPASTTSVDADDAPTGVKNNNSDDHTPDQEADGNSAAEMMLGCLRLSCQEGT
jgi:hypothetical protein